MADEGKSVGKKTEDTKRSDKFNNIVQILLRYESVYAVKLVVFGIIFQTVYVNPFCEYNWQSKELIGLFTFVMSVSIDCVVLAQNSSFKVKGVILYIHFAYMCLMLICCGFMALVFLQKVEITEVTVSIADVIGVFCCLGPLIELAYDTTFHIQSEVKNLIT